MTVTGCLQIVVLIAVLTALTPLVGGYMARVYQGERVALAPLLGPVERFLYRVFGVDAERQQRWVEYARSLLVFSAASWLMLYLVLRTQRIQPFDPQGFTHSGPWDLSFNTASSFVSNTSWQYYAGETTLSDFSQMAGITVASFTSMATGMAVAAAVIRGLGRRGTDRLGNFWVDLTRSLLYVLLPIAALAAILLVATGVPQTLEHYLNAHGPTGLSQTIAIGPVASQEAIKLMSGDGGGFFNTNSAHPFENPTAISNFVEILLMLLIPAAFTATFGRMIGRPRQGWALYAAMLAIFVAGTAFMYAAETRGTPAQHAAGVHTAVRAGSTGGNMEGKEQRFGIAGSALFVSAGTASGDGAVNSAVESYTGLGSGVAIAEHDDRRGDLRRPGLGPVRNAPARRARRVHRGADGRTHARVPRQADPGARDQARLHRRAVRAAARARVHRDRGRYLSRTPVDVDARTARVRGGSVRLPVAGPEQWVGVRRLQRIRPTGRWERRLAWIAFADLAGGWVMTLGRFVPIVAVLALAGALGPRRIAPPGLGTLRTDTPTFVIFLIGFIAVFSVLTFLTVLVIAPFAQALSSHLFA